MRAPDFWYPESDKGAGRFAAFLMTPLGWLYGLAGLWSWGITKPYRPSVPVICLGNLTAGGTGKTPLCQLIAQELTKAGETVAIVSRGYGGRLAGPIKVDTSNHSHLDVGDEPLMLAQQADVFVGKDRVKAVQLAEQSGASAIILDDGFQNPGVKKTLNVLVVDAQRQFGNGKLIPAGPLREFKTRGLARADVMIEMSPEQDKTLRSQLPVEKNGLPLFHAYFTPHTKEVEIADRRFVAFAGIGNPERFFDSLSTLHANLVECIPYPDHHSYHRKDFTFLTGLAQERNAKLITTAKDAVRLPHEMLDQVETLGINAKIFEEDAFNSLLQITLREARS